MTNDRVFCTPRDKVAIGKTGTNGGQCTPVGGINPNLVMLGKAITISIILNPKIKVS